MKYWVFINEEVMPTPYDAAELCALPGFNGQTLIMPVDAPEGAQWIAAQNFSDVTAAAPNAAPGPENYQEITDPNTIPVSYAREAAAQPAVQNAPAPAAAGNDLEKKLFEKMDFLLNEIRELKQELNTITSAHDGARAPSQTPKKVLPQQEPEQEENPPVPGVIYGAGTQYVPEPVLPSQNFNTEEIKDLSMLATANDNFLQNAVQADISRREQLTSASAAEDLPKQENDLLDLATLHRKKQEEPLAEPTPAQPEPAVQPQTLKEIEEVKEEPLPAITELQAEELQAEPYTGESAMYKEPAQEEYKPEPLPVAPAEGLEPLPAEEPHEPLGPARAQQSDNSEEATARVADTPNEQEEAVLNEFAQDKNLKQSADINFQILEPEREEKQAQSLEELTARSAAPAEAGQNAPVQNVQAVEDDKFLKTFTTGIEEVFMDQPTSIISDYVPPAVADASRRLADGANPDSQTPLIQKAVGDMDEEQFSPLEDLTGDKSSQNSSTAQPTVQSVRRIKPAAIKTVPILSADGKDIQNLDYGGEPQVEEITIDAEPSPILKFVKMFSALIVLFVIMLLFVAMLGWIDIIPREWSPLHSVLDKFVKPAASKQDTTQVSTPLSAVAGAQPLNVAGGDAAQTPPPYAQEWEAALSQVINSARNYLLLDGMTLAEKIDLLYPSLSGKILWTADPAIDPGDYSVKITLPPNNEGYGMSYRFNYNMNTHTLTPTTSEANNLMNQKIDIPAK
ncbi:MAG: hypothetical protein LBG16_04835 [Elusimicrobiota bacterium]|jgi:hypothetical protein|nr:hypothetical protein [Elusimicrobiota bacterium]